MAIKKRGTRKTTGVSDENLKCPKRATFNVIISGNKTKLCTGVPLRDLFAKSGWLKKAMCVCGNGKYRKNGRSPELCMKAFAS